MSLLDLPDDVWDHIAPHLGLRGLIQTSQVNHQCHRSLATSIEQRKQQLPWRIAIDYGKSLLTGEIEKVYATWVKVGWFDSKMRDHEEHPENLDATLKHYRSVAEGCGGPILQAILKEQYSCKVLFQRTDHLEPLAVVPYSTLTHSNIDVADIEVGRIEATIAMDRLELDYGRLIHQRLTNGIAYKLYAVSGRKRKYT